MTERPYRVTVFTLDRHGNAHVDILTYWVGRAWNVRRHLVALRDQYAATGWSCFWGPIGLSWDWRRAQRGYLPLLGVSSEAEREARRWTR